MNKPTFIDEYIATFPASTQALLQQVRQTMRVAAPEAIEAMAYGIPTFKLGGELDSLRRLRQSHWRLSHAIRYGGFCC